MADATPKEVPPVKSSMPLQAAMPTPVMASAAVVGTGVYGTPAVLLPGSGASALMRLRAVLDASEPRTWGTHVLTRRQETPQHNLQKFAYNRIAAANGDATGPHPAWDPV
jgi:hypothetical protein